MPRFKAIARVGTTFALRFEKIFRVCPFIVSSETPVSLRQLTAMRILSVTALLSAKSLCLHSTNIAFDTFPNTNESLHATRGSMVPRAERRDSEEAARYLVEWERERWAAPEG